MFSLLLIACAARPPIVLPAAPDRPVYGPPPPPAGAAPTVVEGVEPVTTASGLTWWVLREGAGPTPARGETAVVHYSGWLANGARFDSSYDRGAPIRVAVGTGRVIKGWDEALATMKVGEKRRLLIPPHLGYGDRGVGPIPAGATLTFEMELLAIEP